MRTAIAIALAVALLLAGAAIWLTLESSADIAESHGAVDMLGQPVDLEATSTADKVVDDTGMIFAVPSMGLSVPLGAMDEVRGEITPPGFASAYVVRNRGADVQAPTEGTVYVVAHSVAGAGVGPGDYLIDEHSASVRVSSGALVRVGDHEYRVTTSYTVEKAALPDTATVWADVPGRLVVITCLQDDSGKPSSKNVIIEAAMI